MRQDASLPSVHYFAVLVTPEIAQALDSDDILVGYVPSGRYGQLTKMDNEVGAFEHFRFFVEGRT
jgi:hypothetical protein